MWCDQGINYNVLYKFKRKPWTRWYIDLRILQRTYKPISVLYVDTLSEKISAKPSLHLYSYRRR